MTAGSVKWPLFLFVTSLFIGCQQREQRPVQDCLNCLIVEGPRISRTAFTNWEMIELTYTVRWLDGYEPVLGSLKPQLMDFGILELDPNFSEVLDIRNEREFGSENFFDIVYHLRYMGEKKGELIIPGQKFEYRKVQSGEVAAQSFSTEGFKLAYHTVLTEDADDIKEELDLGSYQEQKVRWKIYAALIAVTGVLGSFLLMFYRPVPVRLAEGAQAEHAVKEAEKKIDPSKIMRQLEVDISAGNIGSVCNGLKDLIQAYVPAVKPGMTVKDMGAHILSIPHVWEREKLWHCQQVLLNLENYLFEGGGEDKKPFAAQITEVIQGLKPQSVYWHRRLFNIKQRVGRLFVFLNRRKS